MRKYTLRQQFGSSYGRYAEIDFEICVDESKPRQLIINYNADLKWEVACRAGIAIFFDYSYQIWGEITITIYEIMWRPVDTNNLSVLYATVKGLSEAVGIEMPFLKIDVPNDSFVFPTRNI